MKWIVLFLILTLPYATSSNSNVTTHIVTDKTKYNGVDDELVWLIAKFEGYSDTVYMCSGERPTIGYGHQLKEGETFTRIDKAEASRMLKSDLKSFSRKVCALIDLDSMNDSQVKAVISLAYNIGIGRLQKSQLLLELKNDPFNYDEIEKCFSIFVKSNGKVLSGLVDRRAVEFQLYKRDGIKATTHIFFQK